MIIHPTLFSFLKKGANMSQVSFEEFLAPLHLMCDVVYDNIGQSEILKLKKAYKDEFLTNNNSISAINLIIKKCIKQTLMSLSKDYREKLKQIYSEDGIISIIYTIFKRIMTDSESNV